MKYKITSLATTSILLLPLSALAAPAADPMIPNLTKRVFDPKINCYSTGDAYTDLGSADFVVSKVREACNGFKNNEGHTFYKGDLWATCVNIPPSGLLSPPKRLNMSMRYKGISGSWKAKGSNFSGGLAEYCFTAMRSTLTQCKHGGSFENHKLAAGDAGQYWDVTLDPNHGQC